MSICNHAKKHWSKPRVHQITSELYAKKCQVLYSTRCQCLHAFVRYDYQNYTTIIEHLSPQQAQVLLQTENFYSTFDRQIWSVACSKYNYFLILRSKLLLSLEFLPCDTHPSESLFRNLEVNIYFLMYKCPRKFEFQSLARVNCRILGCSVRFIHKKMYFSINLFRFQNLNFLYRNKTLLLTLWVISGPLILDRFEVSGCHFYTEEVGLSHKMYCKIQGSEYGVHVETLKWPAFRI